MDHCCLEGSYIFIQFYDVISQLFDFLHLQLVISFTKFLLFHHFEFLLINNIFRKLLLCFPLLFSLQVGIELGNSFFFSLSLLSFKFNLLFFAFEFLNVFKDTVIYFKTHSCFKLLISFVFIHVNDLPFGYYFFLWAPFCLGLLIFKLIFGNIN